MSMFAQTLALLPALCAVVVFFLVIADQREGARLDGLHHLNSGADAVAAEEDPALESSAA